MSATNAIRDPKARWMMVLGNLSLVAALVTWSFARQWAGAAHASFAHQWTDGIAGLFFGVSDGVAFEAAVCGRRSGAAWVTLHFILDP